MSDPEIIASRLRILVEKAVSMTSIAVLVSPYVDHCYAPAFLLHLPYLWHTVCPGFSSVFSFC